MINLLIYGGYHNDYIYTHHLAEGFAKTKDVKTFPTFLNHRNDKFFSKLNHYFPPNKVIKNYLVEKIKKNKITHIINYNTNHFSSFLLDYLKKNFSLKICAYYNDSPFSNHFSKRLYYQSQKRTFSQYDNLYVYRKADFHKLTSQYKIPRNLVNLVPPSCPEKKFLKYIPTKKKFFYDFAFIGHYETDGRFNLISELLSRGYKCLIVGRDWPEDLAAIVSPNVSRISNRHISYKDYLGLLSSSKVNIGFVSSINNDIYTRRYFECPFSNSLLLAFDSELYKKLSKNMPNILFCKNKIPSLEDCIRALKIAKLRNHYPTTNQRKNFYDKNSIYARTRIFRDFLNT